MVAGWPADLPEAEFETRVVGWLLDRGPAELRTSPMRQYPLALAVFIGHHVAGSLEGARAAYARARAELGELHEAAALSQILLAVEAEGARLLQVQREVTLVTDRLRRAAERPRA